MSIAFGHERRQILEASSLSWREDRRDESWVGEREARHRNKMRRLACVILAVDAEDIGRREDV